MLPLQFKQEEIIFAYKPNIHLTSSITIKNNSQSIAYFKFKLTRPKYYILKPDQGFLQPNKSIQISVSLHAQGVSDSEGDKIKCFYKYVGKLHDHPSQGWQKDQIQTFNYRYLITINGLPDELRGQGVKVSNLKSLTQSKFEKKSVSSTVRSSLRDKEQKIANLKSQISHLHSKHSYSKKDSFRWQYIAIGVGGLLLGLLSSLWI